MGAFYAAHMARAGSVISLATRHPQDYASPIYIDSIHGPMTLSFDRVVPLGTACDSDVVVLATKAWPGIQLVDVVAPYMGHHTVLMVIQNGYGVEASLVSAYHQPILRCLAFLCANRIHKTRVQHVDYGALTVGLVNGDPHQATLQAWYACLQVMAVPCTISSDIQVDIWKKLVWNVPFNSLSVLHGGVSTDALVHDRAICQHARHIMQDVCRVAQADGVVLPDNIIDVTIDRTKNMAPYHTSMCLDYLDHRPLEVEPIVGAVCRVAAQHHCSVPYVDALYQALLNVPTTTPQT